MEIKKTDKNQKKSLTLFRFIRERHPISGRRSDLRRHTPRSPCRQRQRPVNAAEKVGGVLVDGEIKKEKRKSKDSNSLFVRLAAFYPRRGGPLCGATLLSRLADVDDSSSS